MKTIELTEAEELLFSDWLQEREAALASQLQVLQTLRKKLSVVTTEAKSKAEPEKEGDTSWVEKIEVVFKQQRQSLTSGEIINIIIKQYPTLAEKGRKYVTKAVTSKLWVMQERGAVSKQTENGKNVYRYKK